MRAYLAAARHGVVGFSEPDAGKDGGLALPYNRRDDKLTRIPFPTSRRSARPGSDLLEPRRHGALGEGDLKTGDQPLFGPAAIDELHAPQMVPHARASGRRSRPPRTPWLVHRRLPAATPRLPRRQRRRFTALVTLLPQDHLGLVVLANRDATGLPEQVVRHVVDRLLGLPPTDWYADATARRKADGRRPEGCRGPEGPLPPRGHPTAHPLADYAGDYEHPGYGLLSSAGGRSPGVTYGNLKAPLAHHHTRCSAPAGEDPALATLSSCFHGDPAGNVAGVSFAIEPAAPMPRSNGRSTRALPIPPTSPASPATTTWASNRSTSRCQARP